MLRCLLFIALVSSVRSSAILAPQIDNTANSDVIKKMDDAAGVPALQHNYPTFPEYDPSGYKGYALVPVAPSDPPSSWSSTIASGLVPLGSFALTYGGRAILLVFQISVLMIVGVILTTAMCTFTPFCTITFDGFGITKNQVREQVSELARSYMTTENLNIATMLVRTAVETYDEINRQRKEELDEQQANTREKPQRHRRR